jgi:hypothetical protein
MWTVLRGKQIKFLITSKQTASQSGRRIRPDSGQSLGFGTERLVVAAA